MEKFLQLLLSVLPSLFSLVVAPVTSLQIHPKPCRNTYGDVGTCMFVWDCIKTEGNHLGTCVDGFLVGSCCSHNDGTNIVLGSEISGTTYRPIAVADLTTVSPPTQGFKPAPTTMHSFKPPESTTMHPVSVNLSTTIFNRPTKTTYRSTYYSLPNTTPFLVKSPTSDSMSFGLATSHIYSTTSLVTVESSTKPRPSLEIKTPQSVTPRTTISPLFTKRPTWKPQGNFTNITPGTIITRPPAKTTTTTEPSTRHSSLTILRPGVSIIGDMQHTSSITTISRPIIYPSTTTTKTSTKTSMDSINRWTTKSPEFTTSSPGLSSEYPSFPFGTKHSASPQVSWKPIIVTAPRTTYSSTGLKRTSPINPLSSTEATASESITCGVPAPHPQQKVVGGKNSAFGSWPWQASVRRTSFFGFSSTHRCGGALVSKQWIATAGHCVDDLMLSQIKIRVGEYDFSSVQEPYGYVEKGVKRKVVHPKYNFFTYENDLALVQLEEPIEVEKFPHITPICLPPNEEDLVGKNATVTGWGRLSEGGILPSILQEVQVPIISNEKCKNMFLATGRHEYIPEIFMCAGFEEGGRDSCQGDSGGPLQIQGDDGHWFLAGIISWGIGCAEPNMPGVCTRISRFKDWVLQQIT